jgi:2-haloacid dehalogenase
MMPGSKPTWLTFDCYGTLIQWDEGLVAAAEKILLKRGAAVDTTTLIRIYDRHEHELEADKPHRLFRDVAGRALARAMAELGLPSSPDDIETLTGGISAMPPFPEVVGALRALKSQGFKLCIISNTDDAIIAGNVAQLGGHIDRVITAEQAGAYKPSRRIFEHAHRALQVTKDDIVHVCASPHLDLVAARDLGFRCIWIDRGTGRKPLPDYTPNAVLPTLDRVPGLLASIGWGPAPPSM